MNLVFLLGMPENPLVWIMIVAVFLLLFGGSRLPQLAKALGQSKRAFKEGIEEAEKEGQAKSAQLNPAQAQLSSIDDEALIAEMRRRAQLRVPEKSSGRLEEGRATER